ncbi:hypothetical protein ABG768_015708, partial [Culter alburnus]
MDARGNVNTDNDKSCTDCPSDKTPLQSGAWDTGPPTRATGAGTSTFTKASLSNVYTQHAESSESPPRQPIEHSAALILLPLCPGVPAPP